MQKGTMFTKLSEAEKVALPIARALASLVGSIISMYLGLGPVVRMCTRSLYAVINEACYWDERVALSKEALDKIHFWSENFDRLNGFPIWPVSHLVNVFSYSNVSEFAWGGYIVSSRDSIAKDFMLHPDIFAALDILWGPHTIDRFSSFHSRQLPRFNSRWANLCSKGVDAFSFRWDNENNWLLLPPKLIPRVLQNLVFSKAEETLIVPE